MALALESNEGHHTAFHMLETHHQTLHWLPVTHQIQYKISKICFISFSCTSPQYIYMSVSFNLTLQGDDYDLHLTTEPFSPHG